jgi:biotin-[acetyl-CoA-carboxylase] ligase BirA-like protein
MKVINLKKCPSTQAYLTNFISKFPELISGSTLVTTEHQTSGFGRKGNDWKFFSGSLAMSFTLEKNTYNHLTPLAIGIFCCEFFKTKKITLSLKWPNDLMNTNSEKVGGIICQQADQLVVCGLGINLNQKDIEWSSVDINEKSPSLAKDLYSYILDKNYDTKTIIDSWNKLCCHQGKQVQIIDANSKSQGRFIGVDSNGSAQLDNTLEIKTISSGSLFF